MELQGKHNGTETVLLVDDEEMVLEAEEQMLGALGYRTLVASGGNEAIESYKKRRGRIDLIILDMIMPGLSAKETYDRLKEIDPRARVLLTSGYGVDGQASELLRRGCNGFIQKPFSIQVLSKKIRETLNPTASS